MQEINDSNFSKEVEGSNKPVVIDIYADWCQPCKLLSPIMEKIAKTYANKVVVLKANGETCVKIVTDHQVSALPTLLFFKDGKLAKRLVGLQSEKVIQNTLDLLLV